MIRPTTLISLIALIGLTQAPPAAAQDTAGLAAYTVTESQQPVELDPVIAALLEIGKGNAVAVNPLTGEPTAPIQVQEMPAPSSSLPNLGG